MQKKQVRILSVGAAVQDVFLSNSEEFTPVIDRSAHEQFMKLELGAKADVNRITFSTGGGATNASVTFARQGLHAVFMGTLGHDPAGIAVLDDLDKEGVDTSHVSYSEKYSTGYSVLLLAPNGERTILTYRGASTHYHLANFALTDVDVDWMYVSSMSGNYQVLDKMFTQAKQKNIRIMFNPGKGELKYPEKLRALLQDVEILILNKDEVKSLVHGESIEELVMHANHYTPVVIVSDGPRGVCASDGKSLVKAGMYRDVRVTDRTGAGDAFGSGFLSQWAQGKSLRESVVFASANSTSVVQYIGAKAGILYQGVRLHDMPLHEKTL